MQRISDQNRNDNQTSTCHEFQTAPSTQTKRRNGALHAVLVLSGVLTTMGYGQSAPQAIPYVNTIVAGSGATYTPTALTGSATTPVHGTAPGDGGPATAAGVQFNNPSGMTTDSLGNLYVTDTNGNVRKIDTQGNISTFAGGLASAKSPLKSPCPGSIVAIGDGCPANEAYLNAARGITIDALSGDFYIAEATGNRIRKIDHGTYLMSTVAGSGTKGTTSGDLVSCNPGVNTCSGVIGLVSGPRGVAVDRHGNLYIADTGNFAVRVANFSTGQLATVANTTFTKGVVGTTCSSTLGTAGTANMGSPQDVAFDGAGNLYVADAGCNYVLKLAENPATQMVDSNSTVSIVIGTGASSPTDTNSSYHLATAATITPSNVRADTLGNLYVSESTGTRVWFYDAATKNVHAIFGGGNPGDCFGVVGSGTAPYSGCDGTHAVPPGTSGLSGLALDAWGNLYIANNKGFYIHKLSLGTSAPFVATVPAGSPNVLLHFGANAGLASVDATLAPDFTVVPQACTPNNGAGQDNTQDCPAIVTNSITSAVAQYEQFSVTGTLGQQAMIPVTNQAYPVCQEATAVSRTVTLNGATPVTLTSIPGAGCSGVETAAIAPHRYTYAIQSGPSNGTLSGSAPSVTYTANAGYTGPDSFTFSVTDTGVYAGAAVSYDSGASSIILQAAPVSRIGSTGTVTLQSNTPPVAQGQSLTVDYNTAKTIVLVATDADGDALTYSIATQPAHGTLGTLSGASVTYTPTAGYSGADSFTFKANDGKADSAPATVSLTVNPAPPTANDQSVTVENQTATAITLSGAGGGTLAYAVATQPAHGTLSGTAPNLTYTPAGVYQGADLFTFTVSNVGGSTVGTVNITVNAPPVVPVAQAQSVPVIFNTATPITLLAVGGNGGALTYSVVAAPAHGGLSGTAPNLTYTPTSGYFGADGFTFKASDGTSTSNIATVAIAVSQAPPVASGQSVAVPYGTATAITLTATGSGALTYSVVTAPAHGSLSGTAPDLTYTPATNYSGADSFTFKANNGADSNLATVSLTVAAPPAPVAANQPVTAVSGTSTALVLSATGGGTITYAIATQPAHGTLAGTVPNMRYTSAAGYFGADSFTFTATNAGGSSTGTVTITVNPAAPVAVAQSVTVAFNTATPITLSATGAGTMVYSIVTQPTHGAISLNGAVATYTPNTGYTGTDRFTFKANNGTDSNAPVVSITVNPDLPVPTGQAVAVAYNTPQAITLAATGTGTLTYAVLTQPAHGTLSGTAPSLTYTPTANFAGTDSFTFTAANTGGPGNPATVAITVAGGFTWAPASGGSTSAAVKAGGVAVYNLSVAGWTGASGPVSFSCTGAPILCTVSPNPATLNGTTAIPVTVSVNTTSATAMAKSSLSSSGGSWPQMLLLNLAGLAAIIPIVRRRKLKWRLACALTALAISAGISGCGDVAQQPFSTPTGGYNLTVTATAGAVSTAVPLTLTVN